MIGEQRQRLPALACAPLRIAPDEPHEHRDEREREEHHACREEVDRRDERENGDRYDDGQDDLREVARERRLERVDARHGGGRDLCALGAVERGRLPPKPRLDDVQPKLGDHVAGCAPPDDLEAPRAQRARDDDRDEQPERRPDVLERRALESARGHTREQHRLGEHEQRRGDTEHRRPRRAASGPRAHGGRGAGRGGASECLRRRRRARLAARVDPAAAVGTRTRAPRDRRASPRRSLPPPA